MKLTTQRMFGWQTSCLHAGVVMLGFALALTIVYAQESKPVGEAAEPAEATADPTKTTPAKAVVDPKMPDISGTWRNRKDLNSADIVIRRAEDGSADFIFEKRADRIIPVAPIRWSPETQRFEQLMFDSKQKDPAKRTLQLLADGKTLRITMLLDEALQKENIKNGSITEAEQKELLNQEWIRTEPPAPTTAGPTEAEEPVDPLKPARIGLQPATPLAKQMVEFFGPRGARVLEYEEGKLLKMEAPREVMDDFAKLLEFVGQEHRKQAKPGPKPAAENSYSVGLEPATPLAKSLVELFGPRGAKVLEFQAGKRLKVEAPGDVFLDLEKMLRLVANETQKQAELRRTLGLAQPGSAEQAKAVSSAQRLVEQLQAQESAAAAEAATIRQLQANGQAEQNRQPIAEHQRKLKNLLSTAFDLKLQWEELQVKELQFRLSRLERQIGQRKELREKIINRRAGELIEGDASRWDSTGAASESAAGTTAKSKPTNPTTKPVASSEMTTQVHFTGPKGMEVLIADEPEELIAPVRHSFLRHTSETQRYDIGFRKGWGDPGLQFVALLDIYPSTPATDEILRHNTVPITITDQDTQRAFGELLTKVVYLPTPSSVKTAIPEIKILASTSISPGGDVIAAANQFGTILAVLRLAKNVDQLGKLDPKSSNASVTRPRPASKTGAKDEAAERPSSSQPSYQEFAKKLGMMNSSVAEAEEALRRAERDAGNDVVIDTVPRARRRLAEAIRNRKAIQDEYAAVLRDLELQVESAQVEADAARKDADRARQLVEKNAITQKESADAQLREKQSTLALERLKVRRDLYKKAGESVAAEDPLNPRLSQMVVIDRPLDAESAAKLIWDKIGLKFGEPVTAEKLGSQGSKYRGGLPIVEVREVGSAREKAFSKGDVLVGLDKWETTSPDYVVWILKQFEAVPKPDQTDWLVKCFVVREGETRYGFLRLEGQSAGTSKIDPPQPTAKSLDE